jgi:homoserine kinase
VRTEKTSVTAFAPASVSNVACGFDVLGFALEAPGDEVTAAFAAAGESMEPAVTILEISGDGGRLPRDAARNTAGVAARWLLTRLNERRPVTLRVRKGLPLASGLGSSAASAAAAVAAVDALLGAHTPIETLIACALEGERLAAGSAHPDNVVPALCGGFVLVRGANPLEVVRLPVPAGLTAVVVHPNLEIETARARAMLGDAVPIADAVRQAANLGALVHALHTADFALLGRALEDAIAEPRRAVLIPGLAAIKRAAVDAGALGSSLSGSGPSIFALCPSASVAQDVAAAMTQAVKSAIEGPVRTYISAVSSRGAHATASSVAR